MRLAESGRLMLREKLEKKYNLTIDGDEGSFNMNVKMYGIKDPIIVKIIFHVLEKEYIQLFKTEVLYSSAPIGKSRTQDLNRELRDKLYKDEELFAPIEVIRGFVYGKHYAAIKTYNRDSPRFVERIDSKSLEKLSEEQYTAYKKKGTYEHFYDAVSQRLFIKDSNDDWQKDWSAGNQHRVLEILTTHNRHQNTCVVIDENNTLYRAFNANDSENIRIFQVVKNYEKIWIETYSGERSGLTLYTYREALEEIKQWKDRRSLANSALSTPMTCGCITILSEKIIGTAVPDYPIGTWFKLMNNQLGIVMSERKGNNYEVCFEGRYAPEKHLISHEQLTPIKNPTVSLKEKALCTYYLKLNGVWFYGFGHIVEETSNFYKVKPLSLQESKTVSTIQTQSLKEFRLNEGHEKFLHHMNTIHGGDLDFIFVKKEQVSMTDSEDKELILSYFKGSSLSSELKTFSNLLEVIEVPHVNLDYFLVHFHLFSTFEDPMKLVNKLSELMIVHGTKLEYFYHHMNVWFEKMDVKKRLKKTS